MTAIALGGNGKGDAAGAESLHFVEFTLEELWMLNDVVRHDEDAISGKKWPVVSTELNGQVALAIAACEDHKLGGYCMALTMGDLLLLDANVRRDMKTPEGAKGVDVLLKVFRARRDAAYGPTADGGDTSYKGAIEEKTRMAAGEVADEVLQEFDEEEASDADTDQGADEGADQGAAG